jgi:hypothetical protein
VQQGGEQSYEESNPMRGAVQEEESQVDSLRDCPFYCSSLYT